MCHGCGARYRVKDPRARGRRFRANCRRCGGIIIGRCDSAFTILPGGATGSRPSPKSTRAVDRAELSPEEPIWYVLIDGKSSAPMDAHAVVDALLGERLDSDHGLCWKDGWQDWRPLASVPFFAEALQDAARTHFLGASSTPPDDHDQSDIFAQLVAPECRLPPIELNPAPPVSASPWNREEKGSVEAREKPPVWSPRPRNARRRRFAAVVALVAVALFGISLSLSIFLGAERAVRPPEKRAEPRFEISISTPAATAPPAVIETAGASSDARAATKESVAIVTNEPPPRAVASGDRRSKRSKVAPKKRRHRRRAVRVVALDAPETPPPKEARETKPDVDALLAVGTQHIPSTLPETPSKEAVRKVMRQLGRHLRGCFDRYDKSGEITLNMRVRNTGRADAQVAGTFAGTPLGRCAVQGVSNLRFPRFTRPQLTFSYPFHLK